MHAIGGKRALVTGAASGIGRAIALRLAREGADLFLLDVDEPALKVVAARAAQLGVEAVGRRCDLSQSRDISASIEALQRRFNSLDILVNNAGVGHYGNTLQMTADQWDRLLSVNLLAPIQLTRQLLPALLSRPEAHILNVSSMFGLFVGRRLTAYSASKFALVGFSHSLRMEYGREGLGVTAICPGFVKTNIFRSSTSGEGERVPSPPSWLCTTPERVAAKAVRAIYGDRRLVLVTPLAYLGYYCQRFAPWLLDSFFRIGRRGKMKRKAAFLEAREATIPLVRPQERASVFRKAA